MLKITVNEDRCIGCGICIQTCPMEVYELINQKARPQHPNQCIACKACEIQCPTKAINIEASNPFL